MSAGTWAALGLALVSAVLAVALVVIMRSLLRTMSSLAGVVDDLNREVVPLVEELKGEAAKASADLERAGDLVGAAETVTRTVEGASRLAYMTFSSPVVKVLALGSGIGRAGRRLRRRGR